MYMSLFNICFSVAKHTKSILARNILVDAIIVFLPGPKKINRRAITLYASIIFRTKYPT